MSSKAKIDCGSPKAVHCRERLKPPGQFDPRSFRTISTGKGRRIKIVIGCPKGKWDAKRKVCKVGTRAQTILRPKSHPKCGTCRPRRRRRR